MSIERIVLRGPTVWGRLVPELKAGVCLGAGVSCRRGSRAGELHEITWVKKKVRVQRGPGLVARPLRRSPLTPSWTWHEGAGREPATLGVGSWVNGHAPCCQVWRSISPLRNLSDCPPPE